MMPRPSAETVSPWDPSERVVSMWDGGGRMRVLGRRGWRSRRSIFPPRRRGPGRHLPQPVLRHFSETVGARTRSAPTVRLLIAVHEVPLVVRVLRCLHPCLELARRAVEEEAVHVADGDMELVDELGSDSAPVALQVVQQIVVVAPILGHGVIDRSGSRINRRLEVAVVSDRTKYRLPDILLAGPGAPVCAVDEFHPVSLLRRLPNLAVHLA